MPLGLRPLMDELFRSALKSCASCGALKRLGQLVEEQRRAIDRPMRVAFVGKTNAGKSTMLNAFLGERLASTGNGEWTFNVTWLRHGEGRGIRAHLQDGSVEEYPFETLDELTERGSKNDLLDRIRYLEILHPNQMLRQFDLIDTPGLHSFYQNDSRNTRELLTDPTTRPHAIVFLFSETLRKDDLDELDRFHRLAGSLMSGLTAIGGLTKVDMYASAERDAMEQGQRVISQIESAHPVARRSFFAILPVIGQAAYGAQVLDASDLATLNLLRRLPSERLNKLMRVEIFPERDYPDEPAIPPVADRERLWEKLGEAGIHSALAGLETGVSCEDLGAYIFKESGVDRLCDLVVSHFGNRAYLIKVRSALGLLRAEAFPLCQGGDGAEAARQIVAEIDRILMNEPRFQEFRLLEQHYAAGAGLLPDEIIDLLEVTGEKGVGCAARLGLGAPTLSAMAERAQEKFSYWKAVANDPSQRISRRESAEVLADSYSHIQWRLQEADRLRHEADTLLEFLE